MHLLNQTANIKGWNLKSSCMKATSFVCMFHQSVKDKYNSKKNFYIHINSYMYLYPYKRKKICMMDPKIGLSYQLKKHFTYKWCCESNSEHIFRWFWDLSEYCPLHYRISLATFLCRAIRSESWPLVQTGLSFLICMAMFVCGHLWL